MRQDVGYQSEIYSAQVEKAYESLSLSLLGDLAIPPCPFTCRGLSSLRNQELILRLQEALGQGKTLSGFLPICASCKNIKE